MFWVVVVAAGEILGVILVIVHLGIIIESSTIRGGITVNADSGDHRRAEGNSLGEGNSVHEALLEDEGSSTSAGRAIGIRRAGPRGRWAP